MHIACAIDWKTGNKCDEIKCIDGNEFFYLKEYGENQFKRSKFGYAP